MTTINEKKMDFAEGRVSAMLTGSHITVRYGGTAVVNDLSFRLDAGQWLMLVGPNGAGKTTRIEAIAQGVPYTGTFQWEGEDLRHIKTAQLAQRIGVLSQNNAVSYAYTVGEVVELGRYARRRGFLSGRDEEGMERIDRALRMTGLWELRHASVLRLSGGELQRAFLAQVFAQDPRVLILDEPANHLDLQYQQQIFSLIGRWLEQPGRAVLSVVHDLSLARRYGTHAVLMHHGVSAAQGPVGEVLTPEHLRAVYEMDVHGWMREMLALWE